MNSEDDIAAALPPAPPPSPARRQAAVSAALERFDIGGRDPAGRSTRHGGFGWPKFGRPQTGLLASAMLALIIGVPAAWLSLKEFSQPTHDVATTAAPAPASPAATGTATEAAASPPQSVASSTGEEVDGKEIPERRPTACAEDCPGSPPAAPLVASAPPPPPPAAAPPIAADADAALAERARPSVMGAAQKSAQPVEADDGEREMIVTAQRRVESRAEMGLSAGHPNLDNIIVTSSRRVTRGDWNACTVDDPARDPKRCRRMVDPRARGDSGRAATHVADGLSRAWEGDEAGAIAAFDAAIAIAPRASIAYLNRGLAFRRQGDLDRALADLNAAVAYAPRSARAYYNRSRLLRERGDRRRADADEERAIQLDDRYADIDR